MNQSISMADVLNHFGVSSNIISDVHQRELDEQGYTIFHNIIDLKWLDLLQKKFEDLIEVEGEKAGIEANAMDGVRRLADLTNKGEIFDNLYTHPLVLGAAYHIIKRPFKIVSLNGHDPMHKQGQQILHSDFGGERDGVTFHQINSLWMLDDLSEENGATRVIPGSHRWLDMPIDQLEDLLKPHPDEVFITAPAGSMAVFNGQIWHGSTTNHNGKPRRVYHGAFCAREHKQQTDQRAYLRPETKARIDIYAQYILDIL